MRGSGWLIPGLALVIWLGVVLWPGAASIEVMLTQPRGDVEARGTGELLAVSSGWAVLVAAGAIAVGWAPGRMLGRLSGRRGFLPAQALLLMPICLPAYLVFFAWWQSWPADSWVYRWAIEHDQVWLMRHATLLIGLVAWSWPIVSWCVAGAVAATPIEREELLRLDAARWSTRFVDRFRCDGRGLLVGGLIVALATFNNTTCFDLAEVFTFGNELRAIEALGASPRDVLAVSVPATMLTMIGAVAIWLLLIGRNDEVAARRGAPERSAVLITVMAWLMSVAVPLLLLARNLRTTAGGRTAIDQAREFFSFYGRGLTHTLIAAGAAALLAAVLAVGLCWLWQDRRVVVRGAGHVMAAGWFVAAGLPGTLVASAFTAAYNRPGLAESFYQNPGVLVAGYLARFGFLAVLLGHWAASGEPRALRELRALDGATSLRGVWTTMRPRLVAAALASFAVTFVLSVSEIPVTAQLRPPGFEAITTSILNDMHYQRPQTVMMAAGIFTALAVGAAGVVVGAWWVGRPANRR